MEVLVNQVIQIIQVHDVEHYDYVDKSIEWLVRERMQEDYY